MQMEYYSRRTMWYRKERHDREGCIRYTWDEGERA